MTKNPPFSVCRARGINSNGTVSGYVADDDGFGEWRAFNYDPKNGGSEEFLPSPFTIGHGINAQGESAGNVFLLADEAYAGSPAGVYGYFRDAGGEVTYVDVAGARPGSVRLRGVAENGLVAGFYRDLLTLEALSFVTVLSGEAGYDHAG